MSGDREGLRFWTLPNTLTLFRIALLPLFVLFFLRDDAIGYIIALGLLAWGELSDIMDGWIARARNQESRIGKLLDPMSDTITRFCMFLTFLIAGILPAWMIFVFFIRDMSIAYMRSFAAMEGVVMGARLSGKLKAVSQSAAMGFGCIFLVFSKQQDFATDPTTQAVLIATVLVGSFLPIAAISALRIGGHVRWVAISAAMTLGPLLLSLLWIEFPPVDWHLPIQIFLWISAVVTAYSLLDYAFGFWRSVIRKS